MRIFTALVLAVAVMASAVQADVHTEFTSAVADAHAKFTAFHASVAPHMNGLALQANTVSPACAAALGGLAGVNQVCASAPNFGALQGLNDTQVSDYCTSACFTTRQQAIRAVASACTLDDLISVGAGGDPLATLDNIIFVTNLPCLKYQDQYCYPVFGRAMLELGLHGSNLALLDFTSVCTPCLPLYLKAFNDLAARMQSISISASTFQYLNVICLREGPRFCLPAFLNISTQAAALPEGTLPPPPFVQQACDRCIFRVFSRFAAITNQTNYLSWVRNYTLLCQRDGNGDLCWPKVANISAGLAGCSDAFQSQTCPANCSSLVTSLIASGCCANQVAELAAVALETTPLLVKAGVILACHPSQGFAGICPSGSAVFSAILANLRYSYYLQYANELKAKIAADVAAEAGVDPSSVSLQVAASGEGTAITATITTPTPEDATAVQTTLQTAQTTGTLSFSSVASLPAQSRVDPLAAPDATPSSTSSASALVPSIFALLAVLVLFA